MKTYRIYTIDGTVLKVKNCKDEQDAIAKVVASIGGGENGIFKIEEVLN